MGPCFIWQLLIFFSHHCFIACVGYINMITHQEVATSNCQIKLLYLDWHYSKSSDLPVIHCVFYWQPLVLTQIYSFTHWLFLTLLQIFELCKWICQPLLPFIEDEIWTGNVIMGGVVVVVVVCGWGMKLTTHLLLVLRLRVSGAILLLLLYAFMVWTGTSLSSTFTSW